MFTILSHVAMINKKPVPATMGQNFTAVDLTLRSSPTVLRVETTVHHPHVPLTLVTTALSPATTATAIANPQ